MSKKIVWLMVGGLMLAGLGEALAAEVTALCRYVDHASGRSMIGAVMGNDRILPLQTAYSSLHEGSTSPYLESIPALFMGDGKEGRKIVNRLVEAAEQKNLPLLRLDSVQLLTPLDPVKLIAGSIFEGHATRSREAWARELMPVQWAIAKMIGGGPFAPPEEHYADVTYYQGNHLDWFSHQSDIQLPPHWDSVDFEVEIAMLVVQEDGAYRVGGYFLFNDITHRKTQGLEIDKIKHGFSASKHINAAGWKFVLAEHVDFSKIRIKATVTKADGEKQSLCEGVTSDAIFSPEATLASVAKNDGGVHDGEVITTGTLTGCCGLEILGAAEADLLYPGDVIRFESDILGVLENRIGTP